LGIIGATQTTPTAAVEGLLGLPPLHLKLEVEAQAGIYRLDCNDKQKHDTCTYEPILQIETDKMMMLGLIYIKGSSGIQSVIHNFWNWCYHLVKN
jgi:hypothetical protein